ncbi:MAG: MopE-related protein, partial [Deltaproteobacteria bacterium]
MQASRRRLARIRSLGQGPLRGACPVLISLAAAACSSRQPERAPDDHTLVPPLALGAARQALTEATGEITGSRILRVSRDSYLREAEPDRSFGAESTLRLQGADRHRVLVGIDASELALALEGQLVRARLEMPIVGTTEDWGIDQAVAAHRLRHGWEEGSATWSCAADADTQNSSPDCSGTSAWQMQGSLAQIPWVEPATATALVSGGQAGTLELDVTRDVACALAGLSPLDGWLIKKETETQSGILELGALESFDGAALLIEWAAAGGVSVGPEDCGSANPPDACVPTASVDSTCDGQDDDCDGAIDDDFTSAATSCGIGACSASGATSCVAGQLIDSCQSGAPASSDASCDGVDDDCDGSTDEDFQPLLTSCGIGACNASGATSCVAGQVVDSCQSGAPANADASCDGVDDDCNGSADEDFQPLLTSCGIGACNASGATSCVAGQVVDSCQSGAPANADASCDGVDDDCNGAADEDFQPLLTSCGIGAC